MTDPAVAATAGLAFGRRHGAAFRAGGTATGVSTIPTTSRRVLSPLRQLIRRSTSAARGIPSSCYARLALVRGLGGHGLRP
jgi:hypothetical protein